MVSAEMSIIPEFSETLERLGIIDDFYITKTRVINKRTGSFIYFSGIKQGSKNQTARLKSIQGITTWIIEEGEDFNDEKAFDIIDNSIRSTTHQNRVIFIMNPTTREHFIYGRAIEENSRQINVRGWTVTVSNVPEWEHIHTTYHIAERLGYLDSQWLVKAKKLLEKVKEEIRIVREDWTGSAKELEIKIHNIKHTSEYYYTYIGGWLERKEGAIFTNWVEGEFDNSLSYCYGLDYGYSPDPLAMVKVAINHKKEEIYVKEMTYQTEVDDIEGHFKGIGIQRREAIVADTNEPRTTANLSKKFNIFPTIKEPKGVGEDIREIKKYLIIVDPSSKHLKIELNNYEWNDEKASVPLENGYDHLMDGMRYGYKFLKYGGKRGVRRRN